MSRFLGKPPKLLLGTSATPIPMATNWSNDTCIDCDLCRGMAPHLFASDDDEGMSYVRRQPATPEEVAEAEEALEACPSESIGNDG